MNKVKFQKGEKELWVEYSKLLIGQVETFSSYAASVIIETADKLILSIRERERGSKSCKLHSFEEDEANIVALRIHMDHYIDDSHIDDSPPLPRSVYVEILRNGMAVAYGGELLHGVKNVRNITRWNLREAKLAIEFARDLAQKYPVVVDMP